MATSTAQITLGIPDEGGIIPTHVAWLYEGWDRPVWMLDPTARELTGGKVADRPGAAEFARCVPSGADHLLEDALVFLAVHAMADRTIVDAATEALPGLIRGADAKLQRDDDSFRGEFIDLHDLTAEPAAREALGRLRELCREISWPKLVVTVLRGSSIEPQLGVLAEYPMDLEVLTPRFSRLRTSGGAWGSAGGDAETIGSLPTAPLEAES